MFGTHRLPQRRSQDLSTGGGGGVAIKALKGRRVERFLKIRVKMTFYAFFVVGYTIFILRSTGRGGGGGVMAPSCPLATSVAFQL